MRVSAEDTAGGDSPMGRGGAQVAVTALGAWTSALRPALLDPANDKPLTVVAGNEASDADSIVASLLYAYLKSKDASDDGAPQAVPFVMCRREDAALRQETALLLSRCGVDLHHLVFEDDAEARRVLARAQHVVLVDHNRATGTIAALSERVREILDHHQDLGAHPQVTGESRHIAFEGDQATAGSACTIVAEKFLQNPAGRQLLSEDAGAAALALLGVALIDTRGLDPKAKKATPRDHAVVQALGPLADMTDFAPFFAELDAAKFDEAFWTSLTVEQCLRYDYKSFEAGGKVLGLSSVLCPLQALASKEGWAASVASWCERVDLFGVLAQVQGPDGAPRRELVVMAKDKALAEKAAEFAAAYSSPALQLEPIELAGPEGLRAFRQHNVAASRKQVAPCLSAFFAESAL